METAKYLMRVCPDCGQIVPAAKFCRNCGEGLGPTYTELPRVTCRHCGEMVAKGNYCGYCGEKME